MLRFLVLVALLGLLPIGMIACDEDDPTELIEYDITIVNMTDVEYEVWLDVDVDPEDYVKQDEVLGASDQLVFADRTIAVGYFFRLTTPGQDPNAEEFEYEREIRSDGADITWTVAEPVTP